MAPRPSLLHRRFFSRNISETASQLKRQTHSQWRIKQVTKSNFAEALEQIKSHISESDFIAVSLQKTGGYSSSWHRIMPIDTAETAYLKAKYAAEKFQVLQFAVCPFSIRASELIAHPYNFHLFPRDELKVGMPSHSFSCQSSYLTSMAREGFDFNACINDGISYLSRAQQLDAKDLTENPFPSICNIEPLSALSVADSVFIESIKTRIRFWRSACKTEDKNEDILINSLRKIVYAAEVYGSRPSLSINVCTDRQVQLALESLKEFPDVVPLLYTAKEGGTQVVRVVLTSSEEDKDYLKEEIQELEKEHNKRICGFGEVINLISNSQKPIVAHDSLNGFTFIYSKFFGPLPSTLDEFRQTVTSVFPRVIDVNHLMKKITPLQNFTDIQAGFSVLKQRSMPALHCRIVIQADAKEIKIHGHMVLKISQFFAKLCSSLKIIPETPKLAESGSSLLDAYVNIYSPYSSSSDDLCEEDVRVWRKNTRMCSSDNLVFIWGFQCGISARKLKSLLRASHEMFSGEFDVRLVDRSCAIIVFWNPGVSSSFLEMMDSEGTCSESLKDMISGGLQAAGYEMYRRVCELDFWDTNLADSLEKALETLESHQDSVSWKEHSVAHWKSQDAITLDDL